MELSNTSRSAYHKLCRIIADYAAQFGITTTIENHGVSVQASDRVQRVLQAVDRPNFKTTLDIGNFMYVDEPSITYDS